MNETDTYVFNKDAMIAALKANGWHTLWHEENWVPPNAPNPDWAGVDIWTAFETLLKSKNLI